MKRLVAIVLAAGYATRLYPLTLDKPKALLEIGGLSLLDHLMVKIDALRDVERAYVVSNGKFYKNFCEWNENQKNKTPVKILVDGTDSVETRLGAIGDIQFAIENEKIESDLLVVASDNFFDFGLNEAYADFREKNADLILMQRMKDMEAIKRFGVATLDENNRAVEIEEKPKQPKSDVAVYATYFYKAETVPLFKQYLDEGNDKDAPGNFPAWLCKRKPVYGFIFRGNCYDIGTRETLEEITKRYEK